MKKRYGFLRGFLSKRFGKQKYLDELSIKGLVKIKKQKVRGGLGIAPYYYFWELTKKGKRLFDANPQLMVLWKNKEYKALCNALKIQKEKN